MSFAIESQFSGYLKEEALDFAIDYLISNTNAKTVHLGKAALKIITYCLSIALGIYVLVNVLTFSTLETLLVLGIIHFSSPLYNSVKAFFIEIDQKLLAKGKRELPSQDEEKAACERLKVKISDLKAKIKLIDDFITARPDLKRLVEEHIKLYGDLIAKIAPSPKIESKGPDDWMAEHAILSMELIDLEHLLNERKRFIEMHQQVRECFEKHIRAMIESRHHDDRLFLLNSCLPNHVQIEEVNEDRK